MHNKLHTIYKISVEKHDFKKSDWPQEDNKHYKGHLDRIYVSEEEEWGIGYFVDKYLEDHSYPKNEQNRTALMSHIANYPGKAPIKRVDLIKYLEDNIKSDN